MATRTSTKQRSPAPGAPAGAHPALATLHPALAQWFAARFVTPSPVQELAWPTLVAGRNALFIAPTGTGKTLAVMAPLLSRIVEHMPTTKAARRGKKAASTPDAPPAVAPPPTPRSPHAVKLIYLSPLRALNNDMVKNLTEPVEVLNRHLESENRRPIVVDIRTGDTLNKDRARMRNKPPDVLITTPESLAILLATNFREHLTAVHAVVVDELHSLVENKRGVDCSLTLRRLEHWSQASGASPPLMAGLSATLEPPQAAARLLAGSRPVEIHRAPIGREANLEIHTPINDRPYPNAGYGAGWLVKDLARIIYAHRTTLIFANTRSSTEWLTFLLNKEMDAEEQIADQGAHATRQPATVTEPSAEKPVPGSPDPHSPPVVAHHSSLDRAVRLLAENRLKAGEVRAVVCSSSLELGIDIGSVDCVVMISTPKGVGRCLQRVGRSGHALGLQPHGVFVATNINDLVECMVTARLARRREVEPIAPVRLPLDVLAQQLVGWACSGPWPLDDVYHYVRQCPSFAELDRPTFDRVLQYLVQGGRVLARYPEFRRVHVDQGMLAPLPRPRQLTMRTYVMNVGTIASDGVITLKHGRRTLGTIEESFLSRLELGQVFVFGGSAYILQSWRGMTANVRPARSASVTVPRWNASRMPLSTGIADGVLALRDRLARDLARIPWEAVRDLDAHSLTKPPTHSADPTPQSIAHWLMTDFALSPGNAVALLRMHALQSRLSTIPRHDQFLVEEYVQRRRAITYFFHTLAGRKANELLSRVTALRLNRVLGGNCLTSLDDYGFMLRVRPDQRIDLDLLEHLITCERFQADALEVMERSPILLKIFRETSQTGLMVQKKYFNQSKSVRQMHYSAEILLEVLKEHEPDHPMLMETRRCVLEQEMDLPRASTFLNSLANRELVLRTTPAVTPLAFGLHVASFTESLTLESREVLFDRAFADLAEEAEHIAQGGEPTGRADDASRWAGVLTQHIADRLEHHRNNPRTRPPRDPTPRQRLASRPSMPKWR